MVCAFSYSVPPLRPTTLHFPFSPVQLTCGSCSTFPVYAHFSLGMLIGAGFWSVYADKYGRRSAFVISLAFVFFGGVISAASPSLLVLCICRVAVGFGVGGNLPVTTALLTEFLPTSHRAHVMCRLAGTFWGVGMLAASGLGLILTIALGPG